MKHNNTELKTHEFFYVPTLINLPKYSEVWEPHFVLGNVWLGDISIGERNLGFIVLVYVKV